MLGNQNHYESPFLNAEINPAEAEQDLSPRLARLVDESPFGRLTISTEFVEEEDEWIDEDELHTEDEEVTFDDNHDVLSPSSTGRAQAYGGMTSERVDEQVEDAEFFLVQEFDSASAHDPTVAEEDGETDDISELVDKLDLQVEAEIAPESEEDSEYLRHEGEPEPMEALHYFGEGFEQDSPDQNVTPQLPVVVFPSGESLTIVKGATSVGEEHYDPTTDPRDPEYKRRKVHLPLLPLLDTSGKNRGKKLSKRFKAGEFAQSGGRKFDKARIDPKLVECLQALGDYLDKPITINSGYRPFTYNIDVYKRNDPKSKPTKSQHSSGRAVDIAVPGMRGMDIAKAAIDICGCNIGIGIAYTYAHIDIRGEFEVWTYFKSKSQEDDYKAIREITSYRNQKCKPDLEPHQQTKNTIPLDVNRAIRSNLILSKELGWDSYYDKIARHLGFTDSTPGPEAFAEAIYRWQQRQKLAADGILGANTWIRIKEAIGAKTTSATSPKDGSPQNDTAGRDNGQFKHVPPTDKRRYGGYTRNGGGRVDLRIKKLREAGRLPMLTDADIDMHQRIANVESGGQIQSVNNYDSAFMSMGYMQWTVRYTDRYSPDGKLQRLIQRAPEVFRRYGIELDDPRRYNINAGKESDRPLAIKGAVTASDLRSLQWAQKFYAAGMDPDVIVEEVKLALDIIKEDKQRITDRVGDTYLPYYAHSPVLRALIHETFNNRPGYLYIALRRAIAHARQKSKGNTDQFLELVRSAIREVYRDKEPEKGPRKAENLIYKTSKLRL